MCFVLRFPGGKAKVFTMSYDDGTFADYRLIEIMNKNGIKGTFNINGDKISPVDANGKTKGRLSVNQIKELYLSNGHEIALHTLTHPTLVDLPVERVTYEYLKDKEILEEITGEIIRGSAYPNSAYNDKVIEALKAAGVSYARGGDQTESFALPKDWHKVMPTVRHTNEKLFTLGDELYLTYTRRGADNDHVFRHRAPIFIAKVENMRLLPETERAIIPEKGARLGNFGCAPFKDGRGVVMAAEWMQPVGCEKMGSDNNIYISFVE